MAVSRQYAHKLLDQLDAGQFAAVAQLLEVLTDPVARSLANAPMDDEPLSQDEFRTLEESKAWFRENPGIPHEEILAEFGLKPSDIETTSSKIRR